MQNTYHYSALQRIICNIGFIWPVNMFLGKKRKTNIIHTNGNHRWKLLWQKSTLLISYLHMTYIFAYFYGSVQVFLDISCTYFIASRVPD